MIASVRRHVPMANMIQMTDMTTDPVPGVDQVMRFPRGPDFILFRFGLLDTLPRENTILLDYDVIVQGDLMHVFHESGYEFDLKLTRRDATDKTVSAYIASRLPHNAGVMFSRPKGFEFWREALSAYWNETGRNGWLDGALAMELALDATRLRVLDLPCSLYNYTPSSPSEDLSGRLCVHYKGNRKTWIGGEDAVTAGGNVAFNTLRGLSHGRA
jgi:hypothetical protein